MINSNQTDENSEHLVFLVWSMSYLKWGGIYAYTGAQSIVALEEFAKWNNI